MTKDAKGKPKYEAPVLAPLGEIVAAAGMCLEGSTPDDSGDCTHGPSAAGDCRIGTAPSFACGGGGEVGGGCNAGEVLLISGLT